MFYSKYSDYSPEEFKIRKYIELSQELIGIAKDDNVKKRVEAILYEGGYDDFSVNTGLTRNNIPIEMKRRIGYAFTLATNPETMDAFIQNNINLFHGTNANALPNILKYGMQSIDQQVSKGYTPSTGEKWSRINGKRSFISFTDDIDTSLSYASLPSEAGKNAKSSFGVIVGISSDSLSQLKTCHVHSDMPEIGIRDNIPLEHIKTIAVPKDKVKFVRKLVRAAGQNEIIVTPISIAERFYRVDPEIGEISFNPEKARQLATHKKEITKNNFSFKDLKSIAGTRRAQSIRNIYEKFKKIIINRGKENEEQSKYK